jgi:hypothetical protein
MSKRTLLVGAQFIVPSSLLTQSRLISAADIRNPLAHPVRDRRIDLIELPHKKVVGFFHHDQLVFSRQRSHQALHFVDRTIDIIRAVYEQLRLFTTRQIGKVCVVDGSSQPNQRSNARILAPCSKPHPAPKTESRHEQQHVWKFGSEKIERRADIAAFAFPAIVLPFALSRSPKIETQHWKAQRVQRFRGLINNFVVHRATEKRMRMAD